jgi:transcription initiation factor IIE alpha subunit
LYCYEFTGFKNTEFNCPSCGEALQVEAAGFTRITPPGTIDIDAIEVSVQSIEEGN